MYQPYPGSTKMPEVQRPPVPASVLTAVRFMYAGAVASLVYVAIFAATLSATKSAIEQRLPHLTASQAGGLQHTLLAGAIAGGLIAAALWIFIARACRHGRNWARITGTVLFGLATVDGALGNSAAPEAALVKLYWLVIWLVGLGAVVFLWRGGSSAFFKRTP